MLRLNVLIFILAMFISPTTFAAIEDGANLMNRVELQQLNGKIQQIERKHGVKINIVTAQTIQNQSPARVANAILNADVNGGGNGNIVLLIVMDNREWQIATDSQMKSRITDSYGIPYLEDQFVSRLSNQDYNGAFSGYVDSIDSLLTYYEQNDEPYNPAEGFNPLAAIAAVVISVFIGGMIRSSLIASMSNVQPAIEASEYLDKNSIQLTENRDTFLYMNVQRQQKSRGGGGSSPGGGGGHSGGGGGGHF